MLEPNTQKDGRRVRATVSPSDFLSPPKSGSKKPSAEERDGRAPAALLRGLVRTKPACPRFAPDDDTRFAV
jgi:hypothetical protein